MARLLGIAQGSISCRLSGQTPFTADELAILAEAFGVPVSLLYEPVVDSTVIRGGAR